MANPLPDHRPRQVAWALYDWANSGYGLVWASIFPAVFVGTMLPEGGLTVAGVGVPGSSVFAILVAIVATSTVLTAPVLGALADTRGWQKPMLVTTATTGSLVAMSAAFLPTGTTAVWPWAAGIYLLSFYCFGLSISFYNAYLPVVSGRLGENKLGGWGFAVGYIGGAVMLVISGLALPGLLGDTSRVFNLGLGLSGLWWLVFSLPAFVLLPSVAPAADAHLRPRGLLGPFRHVLHTLRHLRQYRMLFAFLLAFLVYINGVESVINLSSAFAEDVLGMTVAELTTMYLIVQVVAFGGAAACGYLADRVGTKTVIVGTLLIWCVGVGMTPLVQTAFQFTLLGGLIGLVLGGVQSSSRTLMSKLTPPEIRNEAFGFYAIGTKAMSIFGPLAFAGMGMLAGPRWGVLAVLPFLVIGLALLLRVKEPRDGRGFAVVA